MMRVIREELRLALLQYLERRPLGDVEAFVYALREAPEAIEAPARDLANGDATDQASA